MTTGFTPLSDTVCIEARGADAGSFLHGQLSRATVGLDSASAPLAAWLDAKGRVRAVVRVHRLPERWLLVAPREGVEALIKKLRLFVLRAAVTLEVASDLAVGALLGADAATLDRLELPRDASANRTVAHAHGARWTWIGPDYWQVLGPAAEIAGLAGSLPRAEPNAASLAAIRLGLPTITPTLAERYVAQMLNLDALGAVSFDKGCYPGQEIVARVHNLGGVKRRARRYAAGSPPPAPGTPVLAGDAAVGEVVTSAPAERGCELLALVDDAAARSPLVCGGAPLEERPLPFPLPAS
jgi:folate-binding protein YgfZ